MYSLLYIEQGRIIGRRYPTHEIAIAKADRIAQGAKASYRVEPDGEGGYVFFDRDAGNVTGSIDVWEG